MRSIAGWRHVGTEKIHVHGIIIETDDGVVVIPDISTDPTDVEFFCRIVRYFQIRCQRKVRELAADYMNLLAKYS